MIAGIPIPRLQSYYSRFGSGRHMRKTGEQIVLFHKVDPGDTVGANSCSQIRAVRRMQPALLSFSVLVLTCLAGGAQQRPATKNKDQNRTPGTKLYQRYCAVCHGNDGKGNGPPPSSSHFSAAPPDLTTLSQRHDGKFPDSYVADVLRSGVKLPDHGSSEMPVWGEAFKTTSGSDDAQIRGRMRDITSYIKTLQVK
jgi:mono/diheme cytochrome c family protein